MIEAGHGTRHRVSGVPPLMTISGAEKTVRKQATNTGYRLACLLR